MSLAQLPGGANAYRAYACENEYAKSFTLQDGGDAENPQELT
ncbi:hypothetical protein HMPREF0208_03492 [Citrobacter koseri]|nr:hypothetical protein HMPREF3207_01863 [Citrobacter koseri]KXB41671.1 hypothetical protein HMPREF0208_03492 [Citrobacter koseri]